ncbi:Glutamyl-tRNA synthetase [Pyrodictium delaneyi]|uniref:Glutamate--tRNA ligase n=1 Tax=Pyrodictium delaneyi TaxID=1273541 RepID=A0A0P0N5K2_9CREN|nr:glutamate--tRNA ligase [Pyrodictium delaneyi]ALL02062.1 Glutamyl-tRNA synthetase [Pyrodictium delaneyi]
MKYNPDELRELARAYALVNAVEHGGRAAVGPVMGKIMAEKPELRPHAREIVAIVREVVAEVNKLSLDEQKRLLEEKYSWVLEKLSKPKEQEKTLPPLPGAEEGKIVTRFAPNPDFVIHLGNARPAILSYEYKVIYKGKMILRFEDTDPRTKTPLPEAYELIKQDLEWLGIRWDEEYIQSLRMPIYYQIIKELLEKGHAYVDDKPGEEFRKYRNSGKLSEYPPRLRTAEENLELWDQMLEGRFAEGEAVVRIKTDPNHPDPSVRDWVAFRIIDTSRYPHPLVGDRYIVWPTYNFAAGVDDWLMGVTHILRAKEHMQNTIKQKYVYEYMGWKYPHVVHFGRLKLEGFIMSKSALKQLLDQGVSSGIDDPRFATIAGLRRRGITAEAIRKLILDVGVKYTDASISYTNLAATNRVIVDPTARRIMAAIPPTPMIIENLPWEKREFEIPYHPSGKLGSRRISLEGPTATVYISQSDKKLLKKGSIVRLMEAFNVEIVDIEGDKIRARFHSLGLEDARKHRALIIQWIPGDASLQIELLVPEGLDLIQRRGIVEQAAAELKQGDIVQLVRIGFARVDALETEDGSVRKVVMVFAHE